MAGSRHFTVVDDWVILNQEISSTEFRVYAILRAAVINSYGGIPKSGVKVTAGWVAEISGSLFSRPTAYRALRGLASKGVLGRLNDGKTEGDASQFEFIVYPGSDYEGVTNVQAEVSRLKKRATRSICFDTVDIEGNPRNGLTRKDHVMPSAGDILGAPGEAEDVVDGEPEFDLSGLDGIQAKKPLPLGPEEEFADELERITGSNPEEHLRLMRGSCLRVAKAVRPALAAGWKPGELAKRMAAELNPRIHSPEKLLLRKADDVGRPPSQVRKSREPEIPDYDPAYDFSHLDIKNDQAPEREAGSELLLGEAAQETKEQRLARIARKYSRN